MNKQIALAYGIAGLAVAIALITVVDTNTGLFGRSDEPAQQAVRETNLQPTAAPTTVTPVESPPSEPGSAVVDQSVEPPVEVVYVDEPIRARGEEREHYDDDDDEEHERYEHREGRHEGEDDD